MHTLSLCFPSPITDLYCVSHQVAEAAAKKRASPPQGPAAPAAGPPPSPLRSPAAEGRAVDPEMSRKLEDIIRSSLRDQLQVRVASHRGSAHAFTLVLPTCMFMPARLTHSHRPCTRMHTSSSPAFTPVLLTRSHGSAHAVTPGVATVG